MNELYAFFQQYGLAITIIAVAGIVLLEVLKSFNVFDKLDEKYRHLCYIGISVIFDVVVVAIYLAIVKQFSVNFLFAVAASTYALNQVIYTTYSNLSIKELFIMLINWIKGKIDSGELDESTERQEEETEVETSEDKSEE